MALITTNGLVGAKFLNNRPLSVSDEVISDASGTFRHRIHFHILDTNALFDYVFGGASVSAISDFTYISGGSTISLAGLKITATDNVYIYQVTKDSSCTATRCIISDNIDGSAPDDVATFVGDIAIFTSGVLMANTDVKYILCDNDDVHYDRVFITTATYPYIHNNYFKISAGVLNGVASSTVANNIIAIEGYVKDKVSFRKILLYVYGYGGGAYPITIHQHASIGTHTHTLNCYCATGGINGTTTATNSHAHTNISDPLTAVIASTDIPKNVEIYINGVERTADIGNPNNKNNYNAGTNDWGNDGTTAWDTGQLDITDYVDPTVSEHYVELRETGGIGGRLQAIIYIT